MDYIVITDEDRRKWDERVKALGYRPPLPTYEVKLSAADPESASNVTRRHLRNTVAGQMLEIDYIDAKGDFSHRRIRCNKLYHYGGHDYVGAYCLERQAPREFRCDRISDIIAVGTGELFSTFYEWLESHAGQVSDEFDQRIIGWAWKKVSSVATILLFMARYDGHLHEAELELINEYIRERLAKQPGDHKEKKIDGCISLAAGMFPSPDDLYDAINDIAANFSRPQLERFKYYLNAICGCDGDELPAEIDMRDSIAEIVDAELRANAASKRMRGLAEKGAG